MIQNREVELLFPSTEKEQQEATELYESGQAGSGLNPQQGLGDGTSDESVDELPPHKKLATEPPVLATKSLPSGKWPDDSDWWVDHEDEILRQLEAMSPQQVKEWAKLNGYGHVATSKPSIIKAVRTMIDRFGVSRQQTSF